MNQELLELLEKKISEHIKNYNRLKAENMQLVAELHRLSSDREGLKSRVDAIISRLDGI